MDDSGNIDLIRELPTLLEKRDAYVVDKNYYSSMLKEEGGRLFTQSDSEVSIRVLTNNNLDKTEDFQISSAIDFEPVLRDIPLCVRNTEVFFFLRPTNLKEGRAPLGVTLRVACRLAKAFDVRYPFFDGLQAASSTHDPTHLSSLLGRGSFHVKWERPIGELYGFEISYNYSWLSLNKVQTPGLQQWSIRTTTVYQNYTRGTCDELNYSVWILSLAPNRTQDRISSAMKEASYVERETHPLAVHMVFFSHARERFSKYFAALENVFSEQTKNSNEYRVNLERTFDKSETGINASAPELKNSNRTPEDPDTILALILSGINNLQTLCRLIRHFKLSLQRNEDSLKLLQRLNNRYYDALMALKPRLNADKLWFDDLIQEHLGELKSIIDCIDALLAQIQEKQTTMNMELDFYNQKITQRFLESRESRTLAAFITQFKPVVKTIPQVFNEYRMYAWRLLIMSLCIQFGFEILKVL